MTREGAGIEFDAAVVGAGAVTAVGKTWRASGASVRAGLSGFSKHPFVVDSGAEPVLVASALDVEAGPVGAERFEALASAALDEALGEAARSGIQSSSAELYLTLPAARPGVEPETGALAARLASIAPQSMRLIPKKTIAGGHAASLEMLAEAIAAISRGQSDSCVVGAVDSLLDPSALEWLDGLGRLHGPGRPWGIVPGEAAAFIVLVSPRRWPRQASAALGTVRRVASGREPRLDPQGPPCLGEGLSTVITRACAPVTGAGRRATDVYCDLNGERGRAAEYGFAMLKLAPVLVNSSEFVSPADCWGDVGAASGALLMIAALSAGRRGWSRGGDAVVWCASETGERAAALIATGAPEVGRALCL